MINFLVFSTVVFDLVVPLDLPPEKECLVDPECVRIQERMCLRKNHTEMFNGEKTLQTELVCDRCVESMQVASFVCSDLNMTLVLPETENDDRVLEKILGDDSLAKTNFFLRLRQKTLGSDIWVGIHIMRINSIKKRTYLPISILIRDCSPCPCQINNV